MTFKKFNKNYISAFNRDDIANILGIILSSVDYIYKLKTDTIKDDDIIIKKNGVTLSDNPNLI